MPSYDYLTLDVFANRRFAGNPLAVITDARGSSTEQMQAIAAEKRRGAGDSRAIVRPVRVGDGWATDAVNSLSSVCTDIAS